MQTSSKVDSTSGSRETELDRKGGRKRILVVDDERSIADTLTAIFRQAGHEAVAAYGPMSAIEKCSVFHPDLVLSDVMMPAMNGVEMAMLIRQRHPHCGVILFSGQTESRDLLAIARKMGYDFELLLKPISPDELLAKIAAYR